jgi:hypothetical protein
MTCAITAPCGGRLREFVVLPDRTIYHCLNGHPYIIGALPPRLPASGDQIRCGCGELMARGSTRCKQCNAAAIRLGQRGRGRGRRKVSA